MTRTKRETVKPYNQFLCCLCDMKEAIEPSDFKKHREEVHQDTEHSGRRRMVVHLDSADWYESQYEWRKAEPDDTVFAIQVVRMPRRGLDKAIWSAP